MHIKSSLIKSPTHINRVPFQSKLEINRISDFRGLGRHYVDQETGIAYPSVTTVLGFDLEKKEYLDKWRKNVGSEDANMIARTAANKGTLVHSFLERYTENGEIDTRSVMTSSRTAFLQIVNVLDRLKIKNVYCSEDFLLCKRLGFGGSVDLIADFESRPGLFVVDYKTSEKPKSIDMIKSYFAQVYAYMMAYEEMTGNKIEGAIIIIGVHSDKRAQFFHINREELIRKSANYFISCKNNYFVQMIQNENKT